MRLTNPSLTEYAIYACRSAPDGGLAPAAPAGEPNEDGIVGGPRTPQQIAAQRRLQQTQAQVDEVGGNNQLTHLLSRPF